MPFRTMTGETGEGAYEYEAAQIANAIRELDGRMRNLCRAIHAEHPEVFGVYSTDFHPELGVRATSAKELSELLRERRNARYRAAA